MFQFPGFALKTLCIQVVSTWFTSLLIAELTIAKYQVGCPIRRSMDQSLFSAPHGLTQSITSFIASYCLGIHQTPFSRLIWSRKNKTCIVRLWRRFCFLVKQPKSFNLWTKSMYFFPLWRHVAPKRCIDLNRCDCVQPVRVEHRLVY